MFVNKFGTAAVDILGRQRAQGRQPCHRPQALVDGVLDGLATGPTRRSSRRACSGRRASARSRAIHYDLARARTLLDNAGWRVGSDGIREKDGRKLKLILDLRLPSAEVPSRPIADFVQSELKKVGIDVEIEETSRRCVVPDRS